MTQQNVQKFPSSVLYIRYSVNELSIYIATLIWCMNEFNLICFSVNLLVITLINDE